MLERIETPKSGGLFRGHDVMAVELSKSREFSNGHNQCKTPGVQGTYLHVI